jgi:AcrR family transcriptional regulator
MTDTRPNRRTEMAQVRREAILVAAKEEFVAKGFAAARVEDIAKRADVAKGTVYLSFPDKEQLFEAVVLAQMSPLAGRIRSRLSAGQGAGLRATVEPLLAAVLEEVSSDETGPVLRLLVSEAIRFPRLGERYRREVVEPTLELMRALLNRAAEAGQLRNPAMAEFPQLVVAPLIMGVLWQGLFGQAMPLDMQRLLKAHLDTLFVT